MGLASNCTPELDKMISDKTIELSIFLSWSLLEEEKTLKKSNR